jgi:hypothetical protein
MPSPRQPVGNPVLSPTRVHLTPQLRISTGCVIVAELDEAARTDFKGGSTAFPRREVQPEPTRWACVSRFVAHAVVLAAAGSALHGDHKFDRRLVEMHSGDGRGSDRPLVEHG